MTEQLARVKHLVGTTAEWAAVNPFVVAAGEIAIEIKTGGVRWFKIGDGLTTFANLPYAFGYSDSPSFNNVTVAGTLQASQIQASVSGSLLVKVKNADTETLQKGTPFYISGTVAGSDRVEIKKAIASDNAKGPAVGVLEASLAVNAEGNGIISGILIDYDTSAWQAGQAIYVGQSGGLVNSQPAGYKQVIARVGRVNATTGSLIVEVNSSPGFISFNGNEPVTSVTGAAPIVSSGGTAPAISITAATTSAAGSMSAADKTKLNGIEAGAQVNVPTDLSYTQASRLLTSSTGTDVALPLFSSTIAGLVSASGGGTSNFLRADGTWAAPAAPSASGVSSFSGGSTGLTPALASTGAVELGGTLAVAYGGTGSTTSTGTGSVVLSNSPSLVTPALGTPASGNLANCTGYTFANVGSKPTTLSGYGITDGVSLSANNAFTGANTFTNTGGQLFRQEAGQDAILINGRYGGTGSFRIELVPGTLTASRIITLPNVTGTVVTTGDTGTVTNTMLAGSIADSKLSTITSAGKVSGSAITSGNISTTGNLATTGTIAVGQSSAAANTDFDINGTYAQVPVALLYSDIDCSAGNYFTKTVSSNTTFTVSNIPSGRAYSFTIEITHTSGSITWFSGVEWANGSPPSLVTGKTHLFMFVTQNGGTRWRASSQINYAN